MSEPDPYTVLGLKKGATIKEIIDQYKKLAFIHHPDKNPVDPNATANFQKIQAAYEKLLKYAKDGQVTPPKAAPAPAQHSHFQFEEKAQDSKFTKSFKTDRYNVLVHLYNYKQYIIKHFQIIQKDFKIEIIGRSGRRYVDFWPIANKYGITDINEIPLIEYKAKYKNEVGCTINDLYYGCSKMKERMIQHVWEELNAMVNKIDHYLRMKRENDVLPDDIKPKIEDNEELFYKIYLEQWKIKLQEFVKNNPSVNPNGYLVSVISEKCTRLDFESHTTMIDRIEQRVLKDTEFKQWLHAIWSQNGSGPAADGKRSVNYKIQRTTRRPLRRKSGTKRLRRRRSNRRSRTSRK